MYRDSDADYLFLDWEFTGFGGSPAVDLATWMSMCAPDIIQNWEHYVEVYWNSLLANGISSDDYPFEKMKADFITYGTAHNVARYLTFAPEYSPEILEALDNYITTIGATPEQMAMPIYGNFDSDGFIM